MTTKKRVRVPKFAASKGQALTPARVIVPPPPVADEANYVERNEQQIARTEMLMLKGIRSPATLAQLLEVNDRRTIDKYMKAVFARWEMGGSIIEVRKLRGEGLARLDQIENVLWQSVEDTADERVKQVALKSLLDLNKQRSELYGLTPRRIEMLMADLKLGMGDQEIAKHSKLMDVARRLSTIIKTKVTDTDEPEFAGETIDGETE